MARIHQVLMRLGGEIFKWSEGLGTKESAILSGLSNFKRKELAILVAWRAVSSKYACLQSLLEVIVVTLKVKVLPRSWTAAALRPSATMWPLSALTWSAYDGQISRCADFFALFSLI